MTYSLTGKKALVCGSTQGIGRACAMEMALQGAEVTLMARQEESLRKVRDELSTDHGQTHGCVVADFADWQHRRAAQNAFDGDLTYWTEQLAGAPHAVALLREHPALGDGRVDEASHVADVELEIVRRHFGEL